ncbi:response regulator transcription factor [Rosettibacter firmus]|uniref:response regulator transcription factor n=1 Tax=Rosettibacter firmus TaxID=3111522 RepID=UPI00336BEE8F
MNQVLLIDDDSKFRTLFKRLIERKFLIKVTEAEDGNAGLELLYKTSPGLIFLDIDMPGLNGLEFLQKIRETGSNVPIVVITSHNEKEFVEKIIQYNISGYLLKTAYTSQLADHLEKIFQKFGNPN